MKIIKNKIFVSSEKEYLIARQIDIKNREIILLNPEKVNLKLKKENKPLLPISEKRFF